MRNAQFRHRSARRRIAAVLAAVAVGAVGLLIPLGSQVSAAPAGLPGGSAPAEPADAPVTTTAGRVTLTVDPASGLTSAGGTLKVTGKGFDTANGLYVGICHADGKAPASLRDCVGGAIPNGNTSSSWAHVSKAGAAANPGTGTSASAGAAPGGPVSAKWGDGGSFTVRLELPPSDPASDALDCARVPCALYTRPDAGGETTQSLSVPLVYAAAPTTPPTTPATTVSTSPAASVPASTSPSSSAPASTSSAAVPRTVQAETIRSGTVVAGGAQEVLFAGFLAGEPVTVTLYSAPRPLPAVRADQDGVVKVGFTVPADLQPGTHLLRVDGQTSKVTGVASFVVTAIPTKASVSTVPSSSAVSSTAASSSAPVSSAVGLPLPLSSAVSSGASSPAPGGAVGPVVGSAGKRLVWPWYALGVLLAILATITAVLLQRRQNRLADERQENDALLGEAAAAEHQRTADAIARANADAPTSVVGPLPGPPALGPGFNPSGSTPPASALPAGGWEGAAGSGGAGGSGGTGGWGGAGGYTGYHPGEHGLLSGRDHPDSPGLLSGTGYRPDEQADRPTAFLPGAPTTGLTPGPSPEANDLGHPAEAGADADVGADGADQDGGPPTGTWTPDFDTGAGGAGHDDPEAGDAPGGGRHRT